MCLTDTAPDNCATFAPLDAMVSPVLVSVVTTAQRDGFATVPTIYLDLRVTYSRDAVAGTLGVLRRAGRITRTFVHEHEPDQYRPTERATPEGPTSHVPDPGHRVEPRPGYR